MPPGLRPQNLNDIFQAAATQTRQKLPELTSNQKVARLYRHSLKTLLSWSIDREVFNEEASQLRGRFDAHRGVNPASAARLLQVRNSVLRDSSMNGVSVAFELTNCILLLLLGRTR